MSKINSFQELCKLKDELQLKITSLKNDQHPESMVLVKVGMATSGIASGARDVYHFFKDALAKRNIESLVLKVGDMGYCYAEPTVEVTIPGKEPVVFGPVNLHKADEIIERYIRKGEDLADVIPVNYLSIDEI